MADELIKKIHFPLHPAQRDIYIDEIVNIESTNYIIGGYIKLKGRVNRDKLYEAIQCVPEVFDAFRMRFDFHDPGSPQFYFDDDYSKLEVQELDLRHCADPEAEALSWMRKRFATPYTLQKQNLLFENVVIRIAADELWLFLRCHHLITDGYGYVIWINFIARKYQSLVSGDITLFQYPSYQQQAIKAMEYLHSSAYRQDAAYWNSRIKILPAYLLQKKHAGSCATQSASSTYILSLTTKQKELLAEIRSSTKYSLQQLTLAALVVHFGKHSEETEFVFGISVHKRRNKELRNIVGTFSGVLPFKGHYKKDVKLRDFLRDISLTQKKDYRHQHYLLGDLVRDLRLTSGEHLYQIGVNYEQFNFDLHFGDEIQSSIFQLENDSNSNPLTFCWQEFGHPGSLQLHVHFRKDFFSPKEVELLTERLIYILSQFPAKLDSTLELLDILPDRECQLLAGFNDTSVCYPKKTIVSVFEEQVLHTPTAIAVEFEERQVSYQQLNTAANRLANLLRSKGVVEETLVPISAERGIEMIVGILGILKAGGAYVPIDTKFPFERIRYILQDTGTNLLLTSRKQDRIVTDKAIEIIEIDEECSAFRDLPADKPSIHPAPDHLANVIYTSGTTGKPKGVLIEHRNVVSLVKGVQYLSLTTVDVLLSTGSTSFDATTFEYWSMLLNGGRLILCSQDTINDHKMLAEVIKAKKVTKMWFTSGFFNHLVESELGVFQGLSTILVGGEQLSVPHIRKVVQAYPSLEVINGYGPTENTTFSLTCLVTGNLLNASIPIGRPLCNRSAYVLGEQKEIVPVGVAGVIWVGGTGVARGYLHDAELTKERFIENPFRVEGPDRLYNTGDIGRWLPDGNMEYLGRRDGQVKIRGYRVEPGEVETVLQQCQLVHQAVVVAKRSREGTLFLAGYVVPHGDFDKKNIRMYLLDQLPEYMVPAVLVELKSLPLTSNGKVARECLPEPDEVELSNEEHLAPRNQTEAVLADIWKETLLLKRVSINENFFDLGGHSLSAIRAISAINMSLEIRLPVSCLFDHPTIAAIANLIQQQSKREMPKMIPVAVSRPERIPLSFSQKRLWFIDKLEGSVAYHVPAVIHLSGPLNEKALGYAFAELVKRHEVLRTIFWEEAGEVYQQVKDIECWKLSIVDESCSNQQAGGLRKYIEDLITQPFDLAKDYLLRGSLLKLGKDEYLLIVTVHHIAADGWSKSVLIKDLSEYYNAFDQDRSPNLPELSIQYADFAIWQRKTLQPHALASQLGYWSQRLQGLTALQLPTDFPRQPIRSTSGSCFHFHIEKQLSRQALELSKSQGCTLFMLLLAVFKVLLSRIGGQPDICVGTPLAGRLHPDLEGLVGFFLNPVAIRSRVCVEKSFVDFLQEVRAATLEAYEHQEVPFDKVVEAVEKVRDSSRTPIFQVLFVLQNIPEVPQLQLGKVRSTTRTGYEQPTALFDLSFYITETENGLDGSVEYCTDLYNRDTIERMTRYFRELLGAVVAAPFQKPGELQMLTGVEEQQLLKGFHTTVTYPAGRTIMDLFEEQVLKTPEAIALVFEKEQVSYALLNVMANRLGYYLRSKGVSKGTPVPICLDRNLQLVVGILAVLKAGGIYVPVEYDYRAARLKYILEDTKASILLTNKEIGTGFSGLGGVQLVFADDDSAVELPSHNINLRLSAKSIVCIIYTSGTTGRPKGVMLHNEGILNRMYWMSERYGFEMNERVALKTSVSFVDHICELFAPLVAGIAGIFFSRNDMTDLDILMEKLFDEKITRWVVVPSLLRALLDKCQREGRRLPHLKYWVCSGEPLGNDLTDAFYKLFPASSHKLLNIYGCTEVTADVTYYDTAEELGKNRRMGSKVPIGRPLPNCRVYILDETGNLVPKGVVGELYIGGIQVAAGYINQPESTAWRFIPDRFSSEFGGRMYRTGDYGRWLDDGCIEFWGRKDQQLNIHGYRVEAGEIEGEIRKSGLVRDAAVLARKDESGGVGLVGYVVPSSLFDKGDLCSYLQENLPQYMIPTAWVMMEKLPLLGNGKIDRAVLRDLKLQERLDAEHIPARTDVEKALLEIWEELLKLEKIGMKDNFFELGGHSMIVLQMVDRVRKLGCNIKAKDVFKYPTIEEQSKLISTSLTLLEAARQEKFVIPIQCEGDNIPLFAIPEFLLYAKIGRHLSRNQPFYGIEPSPFERHEDVVAHYISEIKKLYPHGPYCLAGYCKWAKIAVEMAHALVKQGEEVPLLVLLDVYSPTVKRSRVSLPFLYGKIRHTYNRLKTRETLSLKAKIIFKEVYFAFYYLFKKRFLVQKKPAQITSPYNGKVVLIQASQQYGQKEDPYMGWSELLTGEVEKFIITGEHLSIFLEPGAGEIATKLNQVLEKINKNYKARLRSGAE